MLAVVKAPHTRAEISLTGVGLYDILEVLRSRFTVKILADIAPSSSALEPIEPGDDVLVDIEDTEWWRERMRNRPGNLLSGYRHRENLTQAELAAKVGVPQSHISRMESGRLAITPDMARRIGSALNADLASRLDFDTPRGGKRTRCAKRRKQ